MLQTRHAPTADALVLAPEVGLVRGRAHEATGPARQVFALLAAAGLDGPVLWLQPAWIAERLLGDGVRGFIDPGRLVFGQARTEPEILRAAEEALRAGVVALVVAELPAAPGLTSVRRLHLAAEAGATRGSAPLALLLTPNGGAPGIETRWHLAPQPGWAQDGTPRWRLTRLRDRTAPEQAWGMQVAGGRIRLLAAGHGLAPTADLGSNDPTTTEGGAHAGTGHRPL